MKVLVGSVDKLLSVFEGMGNEIKGHWCGDAQISFPSQRCVLNLMLYFYVPEVVNGGLQEMLQ